MVSVGTSPISEFVYLGFLCFWVSLGKGPSTLCILVKPALCFLDILNCCGGGGGGGGFRCL